MEYQELCDKMQLSVKSVNTLQDRLRQLELDLSVSQEKHRTCLNEVGCDEF